MRPHPSSGLSTYPDRDRLAAYAAEVLSGVWRGRLDAVAWGRSANLFCYVTDLASGAQYRLSVFHSHDYAPYGGGPAFDQAALGGEYEITVVTSRNGLPKLMRAELLPL
jgi:hypothetical protein